MATRTPVRNFRALLATAASVLTVAVVGSACSSAPKKPVTTEPTSLLPAGAFLGEPGREYATVGTVRAWTEFATSLDDSFNEAELQRRCRRAFHEASGKLLKIAQDNGGEAIINVRSVVFLADGRQELHSKPECADDGESGEALVTGMAVRWTGPAPITPVSKVGRQKVKKTSTPVDAPRESN